MNIFVLSINPSMCAKYLCDKHVVKMIVEHCQLLSTCLRQMPHAIENLSKFYGKNFDKHIYKSTHINHPCNLWLQESSTNYWWLCYYTKELLKEYTHRYGRIHACSEMFYNYLNIYGQLCKYKDLQYLTPFKQCMPEIYKGDDVVAAYRRYYCYEKDFARWTNRETPFWYKNKKGEKLND